MGQIILTKEYQSVWYEEKVAQVSTNFRTCEIIFIDGRMIDGGRQRSGSQRV
jgi:hypothetical protein